MVPGTQCPHAPLLDTVPGLQNKKVTSPTATPTRSPGRAQIRIVGADLSAEGRPF